MSKKRYLSQLTAVLLSVVMLCSLLPSIVFAGNQDSTSYTSTETAILTSAYAGTKKVVMESYLTNDDMTDVTINPCDIIFVMDQSKWMNTENDTGEQREAIITAMKDLLSSLAAPTTGGEHRVAIAGYGRVNVSGGVDPYDEDVYPGQVPTSHSISFNTGYYTTNGFISRNGWTEVSDFTGTALPQMPSGYLTDADYGSAFMTLSQAESVLNPNTMMAWYSGASRMDAGLTIAEQLAAIANNHDTNNNRNLIVCIMASSLPIHHAVQTNTSTIRDDAVLAASEELKAQGATIFAFGDYHSSGRTMSGSAQDTEENFTTVMQNLCSKPEYFHSLENYDNVSEAMNDLITQITITSAGSASQEYTIAADTFTVTGVDSPIQGTTDENGVKTVTWTDILNYYGDQADSIINATMGKVEFLNFTGYDSEGNPTFESRPHISFEVPLKQLNQGDRLAYTTSLVPLPSRREAETGSDSYTHYGYKVVITIGAPLTITYQWASDAAGYAPSDVSIPESETMVLGTTHEAPTLDTMDEHYFFDGWYTDAECNNLYSAATSPYTSFTLYGKWEKYVLIHYHWDIWDNDYDYPDVSAQYELSEVPDVYTPDGVPGYMFDGWYLDKDYTEPYEPEPLTEDTNLYAKWIPNADTEYTVQYYQQNADDDTYTEISEDTLTLTGKTGEDIAPITKSYHGFTLDHITYEDSTHTAQSDPLMIAGNGSLTVKVYFNRSEHTPTTPIGSRNAAYKVEHYKKQADGSYELVETEFPLYGTIGSTVTAEARTYEDYHVNVDLSTLSGTITSPVVENGETQLLTLKVYYDQDKTTNAQDPADKDSGTAPPFGSEDSSHTENSSDTTLSSKAASSSQTGDTSNGMLWMAVLLVSITGFVGAIISMRKAKHHR